MIESCQVFGFIRRYLITVECSMAEAFDAITSFVNPLEKLWNFLVQLALVGRKANILNR